MNIESGAGGWLGFLLFPPILRDDPGWELFPDGALLVHHAVAFGGAGFKFGFDCTPGNVSVLRRSGNNKVNSPIFVAFPVN